MVADVQAEYQFDAGFTKGTLYLALMGEVWGVFCQYFFKENWPHYNVTALYLYYDTCALLSADGCCHREDVVRHPTASGLYAVNPSSCLHVKRVSNEHIYEQICCTLFVKSLHHIWTHFNTQGLKIHKSCSKFHYDQNVLNDYHLTVFWECNQRESRQCVLGQWRRIVQHYCSALF